eukprot:m.121979 g.121979  ORF g.121979 m.121979 type:complete len:66 (-) comp15538_c5_seq1:162-359(-)
MSRGFLVVPVVLNVVYTWIRKPTKYFNQYKYMAEPKSSDHNLVLVVVACGWFYILLRFCCFLEQL